MSRGQQSYGRRRKKAFRKEFGIPSFSDRVRAILKAKQYRELEPQGVYIDIDDLSKEDAERLTNEIKEKDGKSDR